ncbi:potassium uptake protein [Streptococcus pneumoniae]|nr:potassium uptake protein [Streptococcus pneumoniae]
MKIILVGGGKVGFALCRSLVAEKHDVLLIEQDEAVLNHIVSRFDIIGILGNGADFAILEQASVQDCDIFIALTEHDEVNMIAAVLAKKMGAKETIVRVRNPEYSNSYFKEKNILGFSLIVNPELLAARAIANIIDFPNALSVERFAGGRVSLMEFVVKSTSGLCQMPISDFRKKFGNVIVCAIEGQVELPIIYLVFSKIVVSIQKSLKSILKSPASLARNSQISTSFKEMEPQKISCWKKVLNTMMPLRL